jgi:hypothetical protein
MGACPLSKESLISVVNALSSTATGKTLTLNKTAVQKNFPNDNSTAGAEWSNAEWTVLIQDKGNWDFAFM